MSYYSAIDRRINADEWFRDLSLEEQWLWLRLLTGPHVTAVPGLWAATEDGLARSFGISVRKFRRLFRALDGHVFADWKAGVIYVPNAIRAKPNQPRNESTLRGWIPLLELVPECALRDRALGNFVAWIEQESSRFPNGVPSGFPRPRKENPIVSGGAPETVPETVKPTVGETVPETVTPDSQADSRRDSASRARARAQDQDQEKDQQQGQSRGGGGAEHPTEPSARVPCPVDLDRHFAPSDFTNWEIARGIPEDAARSVIWTLAAKYSATPDERRTVEQWKRGAVTAVMRDGVAEARRLREQAASEPEDPAAKAAARDAEIERLRKADRERKDRERSGLQQIPNGDPVAALAEAFKA